MLKVLSMEEIDQLLTPINEDFRPLFRAKNTFKTIENFDEIP